MAPILVKLYIQKKYLFILVNCKIIMKNLKIVIEKKTSLNYLKLQNTYMIFSLINNTSFY